MIFITRTRSNQSNLIMNQWTASHFQLTIPCCFLLIQNRSRLSRYCSLLKKNLYLSIALIRITWFQSIRHIRARWELTQPVQDLSTHHTISAKDVPGTLLNMALLNLGSNSWTFIDDFKVKVWNSIVQVALIRWFVHALITCSAVWPTRSVFN